MARRTIIKKFTKNLIMNEPFANLSEADKRALYSAFYFNDFQVNFPIKVMPLIL